MLFVITGDGKGKTTSALGMVVRAIGHGKKCAFLQFIKSNPESCGEYSALTEKGVDWRNFGCGFTWQQDSLEVTSELCRKGWEDFKILFNSGNYYLIVLDEFTYALEEKFIREDEVLSFLKGNSSKTHVVITGRRASENLKKEADTVSEISEIKHHFNQNGGKSEIGIEY